MGYGVFECMASVGLGLVIVVYGFCTTYSEKHGVPEA
jgi:hypothetical protein